MNELGNYSADGTPQFGTPGYIEWARRRLTELGVNVHDGFPAERRASFVGGATDLEAFLRRAGILAMEFPGLLPGAPSAPDAPVYLQLVRPAELWEDRIVVLVFERIMGEALAIGFTPMLSDGVELALVTNSGGRTLGEALDRAGSDKKFVGRGATPVNTQITVSSDEEGPRAGALPATPRRVAVKKAVAVRKKAAADPRKRSREDAPRSARAVAPTAEEIWAEVEESDLSDHDLYFDFSTSRPVPKRNRPIVDAIIRDPDYDPDVDRDYDPDLDPNYDPDDEAHGPHVGRRYAGHLPAKEFDIVTSAAEYTYRYTFEKVLRPYAVTWARDLAARPDSRADWKPREVADWVRERLPEELIEPLVRQIVVEVGHIMSRRRTAARLLAEHLYHQFTPELLDRLGFSRRHAKQQELLAESVADLPEEIRILVCAYVVHLERYLRADEREHRFATAARALARSGSEPSAVARELGISPSVLSRLLNTHVEDVEITESDPLRPFLGTPP